LIEALATVDWLTTNKQKEIMVNVLQFTDRLVGSAATARYSCYAEVVSGGEKNFEQCLFLFHV
jgi:hypothetical protein